MLGALRRSNDNLYRYGYYAAMYSGLRAAYNRLRSRRAIPNQRLQRLHSSCVIVGRSALFDARVYARRQPADGGPRADRGVIGDWCGVKSERSPSANSQGEGVSVE